MGVVSNTLRTWLRKKPEPAVLRLHTEEGEERDYRVPVEGHATRWADTETEIRRARVVRIECLDRRGKLIRTSPGTWGLICNDAETPEASAPGDIDLSDDALPTGLDPRDTRELAFDKLHARKMSDERKDFALALDRYGARLVQAFEAGVAAGSQQQEKLIALVSVLSNNFSNQIVNTHNLAVELAQARVDAANDDPDNPGPSLMHGANGQQLAGLLGAALAHMAGGGAQNGASEKPKKPSKPAEG